MTDFILPTGATPRVLIVTDDGETRDSLAGCLRSHGYEVEDARDGTEGLDLLRERGVPSLILLDLTLPRFDGWDLLDAVVSEPAWCAVAVLILTSDPEVAEHDALALGANGVLHKPVDADTLLADVERCCDAGCVTA
jgi:CheY-like chemotaxis protein